MADTDTWMPLYVGDYLGDTRHLATVEHGAYLLLLMYAWTHDGQLPGDAERLRRIAGLSPKEWKASWPTIREFFTADGDGFRHKRIDREMARQQAKIEKLRGAANARWDKQRQSKGNANASAMQEQRIQNADENQNQNQNQIEEEGEGEVNNTSLHPNLAFAGRIVRLNQRDFSEWRKRYAAIEDLRAELGALDDWMRDQPADTQKKWFHVVSASLSKKHQAALRESKRRDDGECSFTGPC